MTLSHTLRYVILPLLLALGAASCINPPDYPDTPSIEFQSLQKVRLMNRFGNYDSITIAISYRDGDGDLGLDGKDTLAPYNFRLPNKTLNPTYNNYFCQTQIRDAAGVYQDFVFPGAGNIFDGRYPNLTPDSQGNRKAPLKGDISYGLSILPNSFIPRGSSVRFRITILDRALHQSNEVFTTPFIIE